MKLFIIKFSVDNGCCLINDSAIIKADCKSEAEIKLIEYVEKQNREYTVKTIFSINKFTGDVFTGNFGNNSNIKEFDFSLDTKGLSILERLQIIKQIEAGTFVPIPIDLICYKSGDFAEDTTEVVVTKDNQKLITALWNSSYFLYKDDADNVTNMAHADYNNWQANSIL